MSLGQSIADLEQYLLLDELEPIETVHEFWERKTRRIERSRGKATVDLIKAVERAFDNEYEDDACDKICKMLRSRVQSRVKHWSTKVRYGGIRLYPDDFEDVFWEAVRVTVLYDYRSTSDFWLYEHIFKKIDSRALDLVRWAKRHCRVHEYTALSLDEIADTVPDPRTSRMEEKVANRDLAMQMMMESSLTSNERQLLRYLYDEPEASLRQIAAALQLGHQEASRRLLNHLRTKLSNCPHYIIV